MIVLCTGDRHWTDEALVRTVLEKLPAGSIIVHGDDGDEREGLDRMAGRIAASLGLIVRVYPANWDEFHRAAGPIRNSQMLNRENPDVCYAWHDDLANSKGTKDMVRKALRAKVPTTLFTHARPRGQRLSLKTVA